jgi:hypothetical protein
MESCNIFLDPSNLESGIEWNLHASFSFVQKVEEWCPGSGSKIEIPVGLTQASVFLQSFGQAGLDTVVQSGRKNLLEAEGFLREVHPIHAKPPEHILLDHSSRVHIPGPTVPKGIISL